METAQIPGARDVQARLQALSHRQTRDLAKASGVPFTTLWKMRTGETKNPGVETVRQFWPELIGTEGAPDIAPAGQAEEVRDAA